MAARHAAGAQMRATGFITKSATFNFCLYGCEKWSLASREKLIPLIMKTGDSMPHSQGLSNNPYPEPNQPNSSYWYIFL